MKLNKEKKRTRMISRKTVMLVLILLSLVTSTGTFAYWASYVEGTNNSHSLEFTVGSLTYQDYDFLLYSDDEAQYNIDADILVDFNTPTGDEIDVIFGLLWEDDDRLDEDGVIARIELSYEIYGEVSGKEYNNRKYTRINDLLEITFDATNAEFIELNSTTETFNLNIAINQNDSKNDYKLFARSDVIIIVTYEIIYETTAN